VAKDETELEKFDNAKTVDECDVLTYRSLMSKKVMDLVNEINNKKQGVIANVQNCLDPYKDQPQPEEFTKLKIHEKFTKFKADVTALNELDKKIKQVDIHNILEVRDDVKKKKKEVEDQKQTLQKILTTLRDVRSQTRSIVNNAKRKKQTEILKILKPFQDGSFPTEMMPYLCRLFEDGPWDTIQDMMEKMSPNAVFLNKEDRPIPATRQTLNLVTNANKHFCFF